MKNIVKLVSAALAFCLGACATVHEGTVIGKRSRNAEPDYYRLGDTYVLEVQSPGPNGERTVKNVLVSKEDWSRYKIGDHYGQAASAPEQKPHVAARPKKVTPPPSNNGETLFEALGKTFQHKPAEPKAKPTPVKAPKKNVAKVAKPSPTATPVPTAKPSATPRPSPTAQPSPIMKPSATPTPTAKPKPSPSAAPSPTPRATPSPSAKPTPTPTPRFIPQPSPRLTVPVPQPTAVVKPTSIPKPSATPLKIQPTPTPPQTKLSATELAEFEKAKTQALEDKRVRELKDKIHNARSDDEQKKASIEYQRALYGRMRQLAPPPLAPKIDRAESDAIRDISAQ